MGNLFFSLPVHRSTVCLAVCIFVSLKVSQHTFVGKDALSLISYFDERLGTNLIMDSILSKKETLHVYSIYVFSEPKLHFANFILNMNGDKSSKS